MLTLLIIKSIHHCKLNILNFVVTAFKFHTNNYVVLNSILKFALKPNSVVLNLGYASSLQGVRRNIIYIKISPIKRKQKGFQGQAKRSIWIWGMPRGFILIWGYTSNRRLRPPGLIQINFLDNLPTIIAIHNKLLFGNSNFQLHLCTQY